MMYSDCLPQSPCFSAAAIGFWSRYRGTPKSEAILANGAVSFNANYDYSGCSYLRADLNKGKLQRAFQRTFKLTASSPVFCFIDVSLVSVFSISLIHINTYTR